MHLTGEVNQIGQVIAIKHIMKHPQTNNGQVKASKSNNETEVLVKKNLLSKKLNQT